MDAPTLTSERRRELAELQSRAYGPDADIDRDADALARLIELEDLARAEAPSAEPDAPGQHASDAEAPSPAGADEARQASGERNGRARRPRIPRGVWIAAAGAIGLGAGLAMPMLAPPHPVATLRQAPPADGVELDLQTFGIPAESPVSYETFHGLEVWSAETEQGSTCVVVTSGVEEWIAAGCAPAPLDATADITFYPEMREIDGLELADGSVVRFLLRGDVIEVWIGETDEAA